MASNKFNEAAETPLHPAEDATVRAFVVSNQQDRMRSLLNRSNRRRQLRDKLNHFAHWDRRFVRSVDSTTDILALLRQAGAPAECHVISDSDDLDGRDMPLVDAVRECENYPFAPVLCCVSGELAFYFDEIDTPCTRILLQRRNKE